MCVCVFTYALVCSAVVYSKVCGRGHKRCDFCTLPNGPSRALMEIEQCSSQPAVAALTTELWCAS